MKINRIGVVSLLLSAAVFSSCCGEKSKTPVDYVNPYMGNVSHLLVPTYPTVHLPNSLLRVYPQRGDFTSDRMNALPVIVTSHRGSSAFNFTPTQRPDGELRAVESFSYDNEKIAPYRYGVFLDNAGVDVDFAPSHQSAVYSMEFNGEGDNKLVVNTNRGALEVLPDGALQGYQSVGPVKFYLYVETEQKPVASGILENGSLNKSMLSSEGRNVSAVLDFGPVPLVNIRYGVSLISCEQAKANLRREIDSYSVDKVADAGRKVWNETLGKLQVEGGSENDKAVFYTSLYRTYERMINISEDGRYFSAFTGTVMDDEGTPFYTDDWIWDTYRAVHPLRIIIEPEMERDMIRSYIRMAQQSKEGWLPTFPEVTGDSHRMNGNHSIPVIADAYSKGITDFDLEAAFEAGKGSLTKKSLLPWTRQPYSELDVFYDEKGFYPALAPGEEEYCDAVHSWEKRQNISVTLGTCYDDWCLAQIAKALGKEDDYNFFMRRSLNYRNTFNDETGFFHPKNKDGEFIMPFDYRFSGGQGGRDYYGENNAWIYRWDVQHNFADLISMNGGPEKFTASLDEMFNTSLGWSKYDFYKTFPDHTGNVGQFSMANEPCLHIPYLYNYAGKPWMTQKRIRTLLEQWFRNDLMGVPGDEDGGGMSAFVVFSQMGFYPVTPGSPTYNIGSPVFSKSVVDLGNGKTFVIEAKNCSDDNKYIQSATLNGQPWNKPWFSHSDMAGGGKLVLVMGPKANKEWGAQADAVPPSAEVL